MKITIYGWSTSIAPEIVKAALYEWRRSDPETFPVADWANKAMWRTPDENRVATELARLDAQRTAVLLQLDEQEQRLENELKHAQHVADAGERLLLTARGEELVQMVDRCLTDLGFQVTNIDRLKSTTVRREDLRLESPDAPNWNALVEVKGSVRGGAKANALLNFGRYRLEYFKETGSEPSAMWYIVNQFIGEDPGTRSPILSSDQSSLDSFAEEGGLAIDTADLFQLWMAVKDGRLPVEEARSRLVQACGRFTFDN